MMLLLGLASPYLFFAIYYGTQFKGPAPVWFTNTLMGWFIENFCIALLAGRRILKGQVVNSEVAREGASQAADMATRLVTFWILLFVVGLIAAIEKKIPLNRALPAGAFLLFFIVIFGFGALRAKGSGK